MNLTFLDNKLARDVYSPNKLNNGKKQIPEELGYITAMTVSRHTPGLTKAPRKAVREAGAAQSCAELCRAARPPLLPCCNPAWALVMPIFAREHGDSHPPAKASAEETQPPCPSGGSSDHGTVTRVLHVAARAGILETL